MSSARKRSLLQKAQYTSRVIKGQADFVEAQGAQISALAERIAKENRELKEALKAQIAGHQHTAKELADTRAKLADCQGALGYIYQCHGRIYGVGWDRVLKNPPADILCQPFTIGAP